MNDRNLLPILEEAVPAMMDRKAVYMEMFNKNVYKDAFEQYLEEQKAWLTALGRLSSEEVSDSDFMKEIAGQFIRPAKEALENIPSRSKRDKALLDLNMYMVTYVLPGILECSDRDSGKLMADVICRAWAEHFKNSRIQAARYTDIDAGFKRKLCYITTAVCEALHRGEDCEELLLLKQFRDGFLTDRPGGEEMIRAYYDIAPTIVKRIGRTEQPEKEYISLYERYISKCICLIKEEAYEECLALYRDMVLILKERFLITKR